jgi:hypothetical protein
MPEAESSSVNGRLKTTVPVIPDTPVGHFRLNLFGGKKGYLVNTRDLCSAPAVSKIEITGQNGRTVTRQVRTKTACGSGKGAQKRRHSRSRHS